MTNEQIAIRQWLSKPAPYYDACACRGPQDGYPHCPCIMPKVEKVEVHYFEEPVYAADVTAEFV